ncbi:hypothetical protein PASE110613_09225 [Paenibacillus sediminis]
MEYYGDLTKENTRLPKETIVAAEEWHKTALQGWKEKRALSLIRETLTKGLGEGGRVIWVTLKWIRRNRREIIR